MSDANAIISSGTDWLTVTEVTGPRAKDLEMIAYDIQQQFIPRDALPKSWKGQGYTGHTIGGLAFGTRNDHEAILRLSGELARKAYPAIAIDWTRVTRIDLQVTVAFKQRDDRMALRKYEELRNSTKSGKIDSPYKLISSNTGDTLYFGKRTHATMLRFYDKSLDYGMEQTGYAWRYEVEYKKRKAKNIAKTVAFMKDPYSEIAALVAAEYKARDFKPAFYSTGTVTAMEVGLAYKTPTSQLKWLEKCVAPVVTKLIDLGYEDQVINKLRLRDLNRGV